MTDIKTIGISSLIALCIVTAGMITPGLFAEQQYYCESRPEIGLNACDSFSKYVADNGKCVKDDAPNLICKTGWVLVFDDMSDIDEPELNYNYEPSTGDVLCHPPPRSYCEEIN